MFYNIKQKSILNEEVRLSVDPLKSVDRRRITVKLNTQTNEVLLKRVGTAGQFVPLDQFLDANQNHLDLKKELDEFIAERNYVHSAITFKPMRAVQFDASFLNSLQSPNPNPSPYPNPNPSPYPNPNPSPYPNPNPTPSPFAQVGRQSPPAPIMPYEDDMDEDLRRAIALSLDPSKAVAVEQEPVPFKVTQYEDDMDEDLRRAIALSLNPPKTLFDGGEPIEFEYLSYKLDLGDTILPPIIKNYEPSRPASESEESVSNFDIDNDVNSEMLAEQAAALAAFSKNNIPPLDLFDIELARELQEIHGDESDNEF